MRGAKDAQARDSNTGPGDGLGKSRAVCEFSEFSEFSGF